MSPSWRGTTLVEHQLLPAALLLGRWSLVVGYGEWLGILPPNFTAAFHQHCYRFPVKIE
jgi:hypothetical protein